MNKLDKKEINKEEYLNVTQIGKKLSDILGLKKVVTGKEINETFCDLSFQKRVDTAEIKYVPTPEYNFLAKKVKVPFHNKEYNFYLKWHKSIILYLLDINVKENSEKNIVRIIKRLQLINLVDLNEINFLKLENRLLKLL